MFTIFHFHPYLGKIPVLTNIFKWVETINQFQHMIQHDYLSTHFPSFPVDVAASEFLLAPVDGPQDILHKPGSHEAAFEVQPPEEIHAIYNMYRVF